MKKLELLTVDKVLAAIGLPSSNDIVGKKFEFSFTTEGNVREEEWPKTRKVEIKQTFKGVVQQARLTTQREGYPHETVTQVMLIFETDNPFFFIWMRYNLGMNKSSRIHWELVERYAQSSSRNNFGKLKIG